MANVFFTCMRFLRIAYPNLLLEMCVHGGMLAHFSTSFFFFLFFTTLKAMLPVTYDFLLMYIYTFQFLNSPQDASYFWTHGFLGCE